MMVLTAARVSAPTSLEDAVATAEAVVRALRRHLHAVWSTSPERDFMLTDASIEPAILLGRVHPMRRAARGGATHVIPLVTTRGTRPSGELAMAIGAPVEFGTRIRLVIDAPRFDPMPDAFLTLLAEVVDALRADAGSMTPRSWEREGLAWARLMRARPPRVTGLVRACRQGTLVVQHDGAPLDDSEAARAEARGRSTAEPTDAEPLEPRSELSVTDRTAEIASGVLRAPVLPFAALLSKLPTVVPSDPPSRSTSEDPLDSTVELTRGHTLSPALPFTGARKAPPNLTVAQYAELRTDLAAAGEDDADTLARFGIASASEKEAVQTQFAELFREDARSQAEFLEALRRLAGTRPR